MKKSKENFSENKQSLENKNENDNNSLIISKEANEESNINQSNLKTNPEQKSEENKTQNKTIVKNYIFNAIFQVFLIIVPLIVTPYVSRVLSPVGVGQFSFSYSLITYFTIFATLGFNLYGQREISKYQGDIQKQSKIFWEVVIIRVFTSIACIIINLVLCGFNIFGQYNTLMLILTINIFAVIFDFSFLLQANEKFGKLVIRNVIVKVVGIASIFIFVNDASDVWTYTLINALIVFVSNVALFAYLKGMICKIKFKELKPFNHFKPALKLFLPTIVISIYTVLDKTLIGLILQDNSQNGFYDQADKIVKMVLTLVTALSAIMISRNSNEKQKGNIKALKENVYFASKLVMFVGMPLMFGTIAISQNMNLWFFGEGYEPVVILMISLSPIILSIGLNNVTGVQYLIAVGRENTFTKTVIAGALINLCLNLLLIPLIGTIGAIISTVIAETTILIIQLIILRKEFSIKKILLSGWKNLVAGVIMLIVLLLVQSVLTSSIINTILLIGIGAIIYLAILLLLKDEMLNKLLNLIKSKIKRKK